MTTAPYPLASYSAERLGGGSVCLADYAGQVLLMLNAFKRMENLFKTINQALKAKGGVA